MKQFHVLPLVGLALLMISLTGLPSCKGQDKKHLPKVDKFDPYYVNSNDTISIYGPKSITRNILQDKNGIIWLASWEGIISYDGNRFMNHTLKENLIKFHVFSVLEDSKGNLWFGTIRGGVYRYDGKNFTLFTTEDGLADNAIGCMLEDKAGQIWFGTMNGVSCYDGKTFRNFTTEDGLNNNDVNAIVEDSNGSLWFGSRGNGVCHYDGKTFVNLTNKDGQPFNQVRSILIDQKGYLWLGGNDGLWRYDSDNNGIYGQKVSDTAVHGRFTNYTPDFVGFIFQDSQGNIWTSSEDKTTKLWNLSRYENKILYTESKQPTVIYNTKGMIFGITEDSYGNIWFGTVEGVVRYNGMGSTNIFDNFTK